MSRRRSSLFAAAGMAANTVFASLQALILVPLYVRQIGTRVYGAWLGSGDVLWWMAMSDLGVADLLVQRLGAAHGRGDERAVGEWFATGLLVLAAVGAFVFAAGCAVSFLLPGLYGLEGAEGTALRRAFVMAAAGAGATVLFNGVYGYARAVQQASRMSLFWSASTLVAFAVSLVLALQGLGLAAIAWGLAARGGVLLLGVAAALALEIPPPVRAAFRVRMTVFREMLRAAPATGMAVIAYGGMVQSELFLVSVILGPEAATAYMLNRRAMDLARGLADTVVWGSFGAFAHLVGSGERHRALDVYREVLSVRTALAAAAGAAFIAVNQSFVSVWVGGDHYRGVALTALLALQALVAGNAFLVNYLYRAAGAVTEGAWLLLGECVARVALMAVFARTLGLAGVPLAGVVTGAVALAVTHPRLRALCAGMGATDRPLPPRFWGAAAGALALGALVWAAGVRPHWGYVVPLGIAVAAAVLAAMGLSNEHLRRFGGGVASRLAAARGG